MHSVLGVLVVFILRILVILVLRVLIVLVLRILVVLVLAILIVIHGFTSLLNTKRYFFHKYVKYSSKSPYRRIFSI